MCRLYGLRANEPTKVECSLVHAQNALMVQSQQDLAGFSHTHGWGVATYEGREPHIERQAWAAYHGEHFRRAAARIFAAAVLAHVRRATVGPAAIENTHPFSHGSWAFIHNGTVPHFDDVRPKMLASTTPTHRAAIQGVTDSEHMFRWFLSMRDRQPERPLLEVVRDGVRQIVAWCHEIDRDAEIGLNVIMTDGATLIGTRWGRSLYYTERDDVYDCEICGFPHIHHDASRNYRALVVASEPLTHEVWHEVPEGSIHRISEDLEWVCEPL